MRKARYGVCLYGDHGRVENPRITVRLCLDMPRNPTRHFGLERSYLMPRFFIIAVRTGNMYAE